MGVVTGGVEKAMVADAVEAVKDSVSEEKKL